MSASVTCDGCGKVDRVAVDWFNVSVSGGLYTRAELAGDYCSPDCLTSAVTRYREDHAADERFYYAVDRAQFPA